MKKLVSLLLTGTLALGLLSGCSNAPAGGDAGTPQPSGSGSLEGTTITVAASPTPHAEILAVARDVLAQQGITPQEVETVLEERRKKIGNLKQMHVSDHNT